MSQLEEMFTRLNAKTQSFSDSGGSFGAMTVQDLCAAMAGVSPFGELVIMRKHINHDEKGIGYDLLAKESAERIERCGKKLKNDDDLKHLLDIALDDYCKAFKCPQCEGLSVIMLPTGQIHKCRSRRCNDGYVYRKDVDRAKELKVKPIDFSRNYKPAFKIIENYLTRVLPEAESSALRHIKRRIKWY